MTPSALRLPVLTAVVMVAFAANSLLTRAALAEGAADPLGFTAVRLASGAAALLLLSRGRAASSTGSWASAIALFLYAAPFSLAYVRIGAGLGALVLFGAVQVTMIGWDILSGVRPSPLGWLGISLALVGLVALTLPGSAGIDLVGISTMAIAGAAWGVYSLRGRGVDNPLSATAANFGRSLPFAVVLLVFALRSGHWTALGLALAVCSGALASGVGYALWYSVLPELGATRAAVVQLSVPVIAAAGGFLLLGEAVTVRWIFSAATTLAGIALVVRSRASG